MTVPRPCSRCKTQVSEDPVRVTKDAVHAQEPAWAERPKNCTFQCMTAAECAAQLPLNLAVESWQAPRAASEGWQEQPVRSLAPMDDGGG
eukprot:UN3778